MGKGFDFYVVAKTTDPTSSVVKNQMIFDFGGAPKVYALKGFYKTVLQWMKCLLTEQGTDITDLSYGTPLAGFLGNNLSDPRDAADLIYSSVRLATNKIIEYQGKFSPEARERLDSASVTQLVATASSIDLYVSLKSSTGETISISLPSGVRLPPSSTGN